jgi:outer membrane protein insertion porin family
MRKYLIGIATVLMFCSSFAEKAMGTNSNYVVKEIEFEGNKEIPKDVIRSLMSTKIGDKFSTQKLIEDYNSINSEKYVDKLYLTSEVINGGLKVNVKLEESKDIKSILSKKGIIPNSEKDMGKVKSLIQKISFNGINYSPQKEIVKKMKLKVGSLASKLKIGATREELLRTGYFSQVKVRIKEYDGKIEVMFDVIENPLVSEINIVGNTIFTTEKILSLLKSKPGKILNIGEVRADEEEIRRLYYNDGYILMDVKIESKTGSDLNFFISEGKIRDIYLKKMITKNRGSRRTASDNLLKTKKFVIEREISLEKDKIFNVNDYKETSENLKRTGQFKNIKYDTNIIPGDPDGRNITLLLEEEKTASLQGAISYGSEIGLLGMIAVKESNWGGRGQNLGISFEQSDESYSSFSVDFFDPWIKDTDRVSWGWGLYKTDSEIDESILFNEIDTYGAKLNVGKGFGKYTRLSLGLKMEHITEKNVNGSKTDEYYLASLYPSLTYDTRNNYLNPTSGNYLKLQLEVGYADGYDAGEFGNITFEGRTYHRGFFKKNTFSYRIVTGVMTETTKESQRFWVGGNNMRGYEAGYFQGTKKIVATMENRTQFNDILGLVFFADAGRAWDQNGRDPGYRGYKDKEFSDKFADDIALSAGVGLRITTPIGPLRFDFGWPVGKKIGKTDGMQFYFNMGQSF